LLYESIVGSGFEKLFLKERSGFNSVINFNVTDKDDIKVSFEFDKNVLKNVVHKMQPAQIWQVRKKVFKSPN
jgi:hypothetical protein